MTNSAPMKIQVIFDQPGNRVVAGDVISGNVVLHVHKQIMLREIKIYFDGMGKIWWNRLASIETTRETYLSQAIELLQSRNSIYTSLQLDPGLHCYPFNLQLPSDLPASFRSHVGYVRYKAKATVEATRRTTAERFKAEETFFVVRFLNLNREPNKLKTSVRVNKELKLSSGCTGSGGTVSVHMVINRRCFIPKEKIILQGTVENMTSSTLRKTSIAIVQRITIFGSRQRREVTRVVAQVEKPPLLPYQTETWYGVELLVPDVPVSRMEGCGIMTIDYSIKVTASFYFPCSDVSRTLKTIIIGNIPHISRSPSSLAQAASPESSPPYDHRLGAPDRTVPLRSSEIQMDVVERQITSPEDGTVADPRPYRQTTSVLLHPEEAIRMDSEGYSQTSNRLQLNQDDPGPRGLNSQERQGSENPDQLLSDYI